MAVTASVQFLEAVVWRDWNNQTAETMSGMCKFGVWLILDSKCVTKCIMWAYSRSFKIDMLMVKASVCQWWLLLSSWACKWWLPDVGGKRHILWVVADKSIFQFLVDDQWSWWIAYLINQIWEVELFETVNALMSIWKVFEIKSIRSINHIVLMYCVHFLSFFFLTDRAYLRKTYGRSIYEQ